MGGVRPGETVDIAVSSFFTVISFINDCNFDVLHYNNIINMIHKLVDLSSAIPLEDTLISERSSPKKYQYHFFKSESAQFDSRKKKNPMPLLNLSRFKLSQHPSPANSDR